MYDISHGDGHVHVVHSGHVHGGVAGDVAVESEGGLEGVLLPEVLVRWQQMHSMVGDVQ